MGLESATYISDLVSTNPDGSDSKGSGDNHIRLLKSTLQATFPSVTGAVTATHTELNYVDGVTSAIQAQIDLKAPKASPTFTGTVTGAAANWSGNVTVSGTLGVTGVATFSALASGVTPASSSNGPEIATTEYVQTAVAGATGGASRAEMYFYGSF